MPTVTPVTPSDRDRFAVEPPDFTVLFALTERMLGMRDGVPARISREVDVLTNHRALLRVHPHDTIPRMSEAAALSAVAAQHHTSLRLGAQPELVYFPVNAYAQATGKIVWVSGSEFPADSVWLVLGADGQDHIVGADGHAYYLKDLPIAAQV